MNRALPAASFAALLFLAACSSMTSSTPPTTTTPPVATKAQDAGCVGTVGTGSNAFTDYTRQSAGTCRKLTVDDLPAPGATASANNSSTIVARAANQMPKVPANFAVTLYANGLNRPRLLATAPNGDLFLAESEAGRITVLHGVSASGTVQSKTTFATGLNYPFGLAFYPSGANPQYLYVANTTSVVRFPYQSGDTTARGAAQTLVNNLPSGGHSSRTLAFTQDNRMLVSVGSNGNLTNTDTSSIETNRADVLAYTPDGVFLKVYASGLRNAVGLTSDSNGKIWVSVNERDGLGDNLPPDYVTSIKEDGFYGWPWYYIGNHPDPRLPVNHPELAARTIVPDVLLTPHFAPLQIGFYTGTAFPSLYRGDIFVASHGSWNRATRGGYEVLRVILVDGVATGIHQDFVTGFVNADGTVWGRPVGITTGTDGALYISDDASDSVWRVTYTGP